MAAEIEIAGQFGSSEASDAVVPVFQYVMKKAALDVAIHSLDARVDQLSLLLRVSGRHRRFEGEPVENVKFDRQLKWISCDLLVWEREWEGRSRGEIVATLVDRVNRVADVITPRCRAKKVSIDTELLREELAMYAKRIVDQAAI